MNLSYATALSTLKVIDQYTAADFDTLGISQQDFELASGEQVWRREHMNVVLRTLHALTFGSLEVMAVPKIVVPAEFIAAIIASFVHPANRMVACVWLAQENRTGVGALELSVRAQVTSQMGQASADQLFALVQCLSDTDASTQARANFQRRLGLAVEQAKVTTQ